MSLSRSPSISQKSLSAVVVSTACYLAGYVSHNVWFGYFGSVWVWESSLESSFGSLFRYCSVHGLVFVCLGVVSSLLFGCGGFR